MRLDLSHLPCVKPDHYIKRNGISDFLEARETLLTWFSMRFGVQNLENVILSELNK